MKKYIITVLLLGLCITSVQAATLKLTALAGDGKGGYTTGNQSGGTWYINGIDHGTGTVKWISSLTPGDYTICYSDRDNCQDITVGEGTGMLGTLEFLAY